MGQEHRILALQRLVGNRATAALVTPVQRLDIAGHYDAKAKRRASSPAPSGPGITDEAAEGVGEMFRRATSTEDREAEQLADPGWQAKLTSIATKAPLSAPLAPGRLRPLGRGLREQHQQASPGWESHLGGMRRPQASAEIPQGAVGTARKQIEDDRAAAIAQQQAEQAAAVAKNKADQLAKPDYELVSADAVARAKALDKGTTMPVPSLDSMRQLAREGEYVKALEEAEKMVTECSQLKAYAEAQKTYQERFEAVSNTVTKTERSNFVQHKSTLTQQLNARPRNAAAVTATLTLMETIVQGAETRQNAASAAGALRAAQRAAGVWPANNKTAALIQVATRAAVGASAEERSAVVQALDAIKNNALPHNWARKWDDYHGNGEGNLPGIVGGGGYKEYYVSSAYSPAYGGFMPNGTRRLVKSNSTGFVYYSDNHYGNSGAILPAFVKISDP